MLIGYIECEMEPGDNASKERNENLFDRLDKNKDGFLSKNEFTRPALFPLFDSDKDGRVTRKEGITGMAKLKKRESKNRNALRGLIDLFR